MSDLSLSQETPFMDRNVRPIRYVKPYLMWLLPLMFFAYQFVLRLWPGLMMQQIMNQFAIDATGFGLLAAFYYYGYAGMQIPMALLLDKFGPRAIVCLFAVTSGLAMLLFSYTESFYLALVSRFLIGVGSAVGFLGVSKVISQWFHASYYARMVGYSFSFGLLGAIYGGKPLSLLISSYPWQSVAFSLSLLSIVLGVFTYLALRAPAQPSESKATEPFKLADLSVLMRSGPLWGLAIANLLMVGALEGFADVWGIPYLMITHGLKKADAALMISFVFVGMLFGGPLLAFFSKRWGNYKVIAACGLGLASLFILLLTNSIVNTWLLSALFFVVGMLCCYQVIVFAAGADFVGASYLGVTVAFLNCVNMLGGSFFHTMIGQLMDYFWEGQFAADGLKSYSLSAYQNALGLIPLCAILGAFLVYWVSRKARDIHKFCG